MTMTTPDPIEQRRHALREETRLVIQDPEMWPHFPCLPLRQLKTTGGGLPKCATLVYDASCYRVGDFLVFCGPSATTTYTDYQTIDELLDAGWIVD